METNNQYLETRPVGSLMRQYAIPCIISLLVGALYNIFDQIFIANAAYLGSYGNAANTVVFPLTVVALAVAVMIGDGCCTFVSLSLGEGDTGRARISVGNAIVMTVVSSLVIAAVYLIFSDQIIAMFGGTVNEETFGLAKEYFFYISLGIPFYMFGQALNPIIRADGSPRFAMISTLAGALVNIILDPIFIYTAHLGMMGAAVATVIGQIVTAVLAVWYILHMRVIRPEKGNYRIRFALSRRILVLGITSLLSQISLVAAMAAINNMIRLYGAQDPVFSQEALVGAVAFILVEVFPRQLIAIFGAGNESVYYTLFAVKAFRIYLCMVIFACINKACFIFLQAMGHALSSTCLSLVREVVFGVGFALLLPLFFGLDGVLYSMPVSDLLTFIVAALLIGRTYRDWKVGDDKELALDT